MTTSGSVEHGRASASWLALRESADARARSTALVDELRHHLRLGQHGAPLRVHDLGSGTGAQRRWLTPHFIGPQHWIEHERDLALTARPFPHDEFRSGRDETVVSCICELGDISPDHLGSTDLITASALLDVLTRPVLEQLVNAASQLRVPLYVTLSVVGRVRLTPAETLDADVQSAFNDHQRRLTPSGQLLGPDAVRYAARRLAQSGAFVQTRPSPWQLGSSDGALIGAWLNGWLAAAQEHGPGLVSPAHDYRARRMAELAAGRLDVSVEHLDLLAWWP